MQADQAHTGQPGQWRKRDKGTAAAIHEQVCRIALPADADLEALIADPGAPFFYPRGIGKQIRHLSRNRVQGGLEQQRQTHRRNVIIEAILLAGDRDAIAQRAHQMVQLFLGRKQDTGACLLQQWDIAAEMKRVAEAVIAMNENCFASGVS